MHIMGDLTRRERGRLSVCTLQLGRENMHALHFYVQVVWHFYVHFLRITSTCTSTCALHDKPRFDWEDDFNFIAYDV